MNRTTIFGRAAILGMLVCAGGTNSRQALIVYGENAGVTEFHSASELAKDFQKVYGSAPEVISNSEWQKAEKRVKAFQAIFLVGTVESHSEIEKLAQAGAIKVSAADPGPEAFVIKSFPDQKLMVIAGCDPRGVLYGVYEFSENFLGIDPLEYWTGKTPEKRDKMVIPEIDLREKPPAFKLRGYFDNDSDHLANFSGRKLIIEFELWKEMIDSLARLGYNYIDLFDTLGRAEFWNWPYYTENFPGYHTDLKLVEQVIDYAHTKGMMVQVNTSLGWEFHHLPYEKTCLSKYYDDWMDGYRYYLEETPIGKADLFTHSPRDPWWDRPYKCPREKILGINQPALHTRLVNDLNALVQAHNPNARVIGILWSDGQKTWLSRDYQPDPSIDMMWADNGYALYPAWPGDLKGHRFGIYLHAGFWRNQTVQDPYPDRIGKSTREAYQRGMTANYFVNGQSFKNFILNLEAAARAAWDPAGFDGEEFYQQWAARYFGTDAAPEIVSSLKALHSANEKAAGYQEITSNTNVLLTLLSKGLILDPGFSASDQAVQDAERALAYAKAAEPKVPESSRLVFDDQIYFPALIYYQNLKLNWLIGQIIQDHQKLGRYSLSPEENQAAKNRLERRKKEAIDRLSKLRELLNRGQKWEKWAGWYRVENFRKYTPPPTVQDLEKALAVIR